MFEPLPMDTNPYDDPESETPLTSEQTAAAEAFDAEIAALNLPRYGGPETW